MAAVPVVLVGAHGHGQSHLRNLVRLGQTGRVRLAGVCDTVPVPAADLAPFVAAGPVEQDADLAALLARVRPVVTILATPIHTHLALARTVLASGSHLLLEKPPTATLAEYRALAAEVAASGLACQVGFQSLGSTAVDSARDLVGSGAIGRVRGIGGAGAWRRTSAYYDRAPWAGRRRMDGHDVVDGALTNPFAHAVATALRLCGASDGIDADRVELELFHAHDIESDDTSALRFPAPDGTPVSIAVTLCAERRHEPYLAVHGDAGELTLRYTLDEIELRPAGGVARVTRHPRADLLENLLAHLAGAAELLVPLADTAGFMQVLEAVRLAPDPVAIPAAAQESRHEPDGVTHHVPGIERLVADSARRMALFSELGAAWASTSGPTAPAATAP